MLIVKQSERFKGLGSSRFKSEKEVENIIMKIKNIEDIIKEKLFIIGRQVTFDEIDETLDYLALDKQGNMVVIELKKTFYSATNSDFQTTKYAGYISQWSLADIKEQAEGYIYGEEKRRINFEIEARKFLDVDLSYINNQGPRIILIGSKENQKLNVACDWLYGQGVDIAIYKLERYVEGSNEFIVSNKLIPGKKLKKYGPGLDDYYDKKYHLNKCTHKTGQVVEAFVETIEELYNLDGPDWSNKSKVKFTKSGKNMVEFRINKQSINVTRNRSFFNPFSWEEVERALKNKLDFSIEGKVNI